MYKHSMTKTCCDVRYKVIFTDINMPVMDGITEAKKIQKLQKKLLKEDPSLPEVCIVMVSAIDDRNVIEQTKAIGIKHYLTKPVTATQILSIMREVYGDESLEQRSSCVGSDEYSLND